MHPLSITAYFANNSELLVRLATLPDACPICHRAIQANFRYAHAFADKTMAQGMFVCGHKSCQQAFLADYRLVTTSHGSIDGILRRCYPLSPRKNTFPKNVSDLSPDFVEIIDQADRAESLDLDQLVGIGYRKALEFLIKDYLAGKFPDRAQAVRAKQLGNCIREMVTDPNVKLCAERAAWLGNDETHYVRKWEDRDIEDLKRLVKLTVSWIDIEVTTNDYLRTMPEGR